jgi:nicotinate-nucleotide--dimethylbenzimidazole phosphoribosyltransferase
VTGGRTHTGTRHLAGQAIAVDDLVDQSAEDRAAVQARVNDILRPAGALARLDELAVWVAGWQRTTNPSIDKPVALIFAGDHGVSADGVSAYPIEVTGAMLEAFNQSKASISAMAAVAGATVHAVDVGVGLPTANIRTDPAMDHERLAASVAAGRAAVAEQVDGGGIDLLIVGEMGIGNTTAAAAISCALLERLPQEVVGIGTGIPSDRLARKVAIVGQAVTRAAAADADITNPSETLRHLGGTEVAAMTGALLEARARSIPVLLDGYVTSAAALVLHSIDPRLTEHIRAGHRSAEPGHRLVLERLGLEPLIELDLRLGEASGAMAALPLVQMACKLVTDVATFTEWFAEPSS